MSENKSDPNAPPISAEQLRMVLLQKEVEKADLARKATEAKEKKLTEFATDFLENHVTPDEIATVRRLVMNAVQDGRLEAMVYSFPSELCTDGGRAINNGDPEWPSTLRGKAKEFYDRFMTLGKPQGYKLKVTVINFPGGMPGDIGFFLNWEPPVA